MPRTMLSLDSVNLLLVQLLGGTILLLAIAYTFRNALYPRPLDFIPYNQEASKRILGDLPDIQASGSMSNWLALQPTKHQSPLFQAFVRPFSKPWVVVADHHEVAEICIRRVKEFDRADATISVFWGVVPSAHLTLKTSNPQFRKNKELVRDLMTPSFLTEVSAPEIYDKFERLLELWDRKAKLSKGRPFAASREIHHAALDIIVCVSFGIEPGQTQLVREMEALDVDHDSPTNATGGPEDEFLFKEAVLEEELEAFTVLSASVTKCMTSSAPELYHFLYRHLSPTMRNALRLAKRLQTREIANGIKRRSSGQPQRCAVDQVLAREEIMAEKEGRKPQFYSQTITGELMIYLIGGHETTSSALRWGISYLSNDQRVQTRLREALDQAYHQAKAEKRLPTLSEIVHTRIPYLDAVVEETLRCARPIAICIREPHKDTQILGAHIPKGTTVVFLANGPSVLTPTIPFDEARQSEWAASRRRKRPVVDESDIGAFYPERWLRTEKSADGTEETVFDANLFPIQGFGIGPRSCFGKRLAYLEMKIFFTLVIWKFDFLSLPKALSKPTEFFALTRNPNEIYVKLQSRV
ncbi:hypothetical protein FZEAL_7074 [Fusarium zealandicum]|uniref:Cytochrome P450 monooxygenase n=1 Tax=Fusarium zealandicum TaxID=1053134 RepID=A0A8H4UGS3_9HYPO|nr:hypothetical protein FZEAL_7074 [Fusarium zealandicum]